MGLFDLFRGSNINEGVEECRNTEGAVLLDVRDHDEYSSGHIPGSINVSLKFLTHKIEDFVPDKNTPLFVYCLSGARSGQAVSLLKQSGYLNVRNIGGINGYKGAVER